MLGARAIFRSFWPYTEGLRGWIVLDIVLSLLSPILPAATIWISKLLIDNVLIPHDFHQFWRIAGVYLVIAAFAGMVGFLASYLSSWLSLQFTFALQVQFFSKLEMLSLDVLGRYRLGDLLSRLTSDVTAVRRVVVSALSRTVTNVGQTVVFAGLIFWLSWRMALVLLIAGPLFALLARTFSRRIKAISRESRRYGGAMMSVAEESLGNAPLVQAYQQQVWEVRRFRRVAEDGMNMQLRSARLSAGFSPLVDIVEVLAVLVVVGLGVWQIALGHLTVGGLIAFLGYLSQVISPIQSLAQLANTVYDATAGAERISELTTATSSVPEPVTPVVVPRATGALELDDVTFTYPGAPEPSLRGISLRVEPGETVAISGASGSGKTTIAKLITRLYDVDSGSIRIDGHDIRRLGLANLRDNIGLVLQETLVFHGTVAENIAYGLHEATEQQVRRAAELADVHRFVRQLPEGYETTVGERGRWLSGGQLQRIAIARALIRNAPILILDEPTTGLDDDTAARIMEPLRRLMAERTTILISHDTRVIEAADRVLYLEHGVPVEREADIPVQARGPLF